MTLCADNRLRACGLALACASAVVIPKVWRCVHTYFLSRVEHASDRNGGELVAQVLRDHNVPRVFVLPGGHVSPCVVGCEKIGIRVIDVRNEADAVFAADATSRLTGTIGVAIVTAGPGVTNTVTAMKNAQMAHSPVLLIGGAAATLAKGRGSLQDIEQVDLFKSITKLSVSVSRVRDIVPTIRKAIQIATDGVPGPVFVELPLDILYSVLEIKANMGLLQRKTQNEVLAAVAKEGPAMWRRVVVPTSFKGTGGSRVEAYTASVLPSTPMFLTAQRLPPLLIRFVMNRQVQRLFGDAWAPQATGPLPRPPKSFFRRQVDAWKFSRVKATLAGAKRPVVIVGSQVISGKVPESNESIMAALCSLNAPCFLSGMARGAMGANEPFFLRQNRRQALKEADVVLLLGVSVDFRLDYGKAFSAKSKIVSINLSAEELRRNTDVFWKPYVAWETDPGELVIHGKLHGLMPATDLQWVAGLKKAEQEKEANNGVEADAPATGRGTLAGKELINPIAFFDEMERAMPPSKDIILIGDGGDFVATAAYTLRPRGPRTWLDPGPYGTLGVGAGFALAAKLAFPDQHVVVLWGDGSAGYSISEYDPFTRHNCPIIGIVGNDACWSQIVRDQRWILGSESACNLEYCDYGAVAQAYSGGTPQSKCHAETVARRSDVKAAIERAFAASDSGRSALLNILIGRSTFREGSLSV